MYVQCKKVIVYFIKTDAPSSQKELQYSDNELFYIKRESE